MLHYIIINTLTVTAVSIVLGLCLLCIYLFIVSMYAIGDLLRRIHISSLPLAVVVIAIIAIIMLITTVVLYIFVARAI